jgi:hypothetical protein
MQERVYYEDYELRITASDIRCKQLTIRTDSITSVSIASARPAKWLPLLFVLPLILFGFMIFVISGLLGVLGARSPLFFMPVLAMFLPLAVVLVLPSFVRVSRIYLQTSGGPVVLALKIQLTDPARTVARLQTIKDAIEQAMRAGRTP